MKHISKTVTLPFVAHQLIVERVSDASEFSGPQTFKFQGLSRSPTNGRISNTSVVPRMILSEGGGPWLITSGPIRVHLVPFAVAAIAAVVAYST